MWKCNLIGDDDEIPRWNRDKCENAMRIAFVAKFQWERDKYSTPLNIQKPAVNPDRGKRKMKMPNKYLCWQEQKLCDVIIN